MNMHLFGRLAMAGATLVLIGCRSGDAQLEEPRHDSGQNDASVDASYDDGSYSDAFSADQSVIEDPKYPAIPIVGPLYYVGLEGSDSHTKQQAQSPNTPWRTLQHAADQAAPGDNIVVKDGIYVKSPSNTYECRIVKSGTAEHPIRFLAQNRWGAVLDGGYTDHSWLHVGADHVIVEGFEIRRGHRAIHANATGRLTHHVTIRGNYIHDHGNNAPVNDTYGRVGVFCGMRSRYWVFDGNVFHDNGRLPGGTYDDGDQGHDFRHDWGIYAQGHGHLVVNNVFYRHFAGADLKVDCSARNVDGSNFVFPNNERALVILNNTFASRNPSNTMSAIRFYRNSGDQPKNVLVMNNIMWNAAGKIAISANIGGWPWPGAEVVNNVTDADTLFGTAPTTDLLAYEGNVTNLTNPGIQGTTLGMVDPANFDFRLTSSAVLIIDQGKAVHHRTGLPDDAAPPKDHAGVFRPQGGGVDLGAYEYMP